MILAIVGSAVWMLPAASQLLDSTLDDVIDRQVAEQVEEQVAEELADAVQEQVESDVTQQVETTVTDAVEQQLESEIVDAVQQQVESGVVGAITSQVESVVAGEVGDELLDAVEGQIDDIGREVGGVAEGVAQLGSDRSSAGGDANGARTETFAGSIDGLGRSIERDIWLILVPAEHAARIEGWGFTIRERQDLATLGRILLRVAAPEDREIAQAALELALDAPGTEVDFNHVYRPGADDDAKQTPMAVPAPMNGGATPHLPPVAVAVGVVDTAVATEHEALRGADIVQRDFVPFKGERPNAHGTAVASILVGDSVKLRPQLRGGRVYAASVFFADPDGNDASTAASLAVAGEWLAAEGVRVINMSLAGPPNRVLQAAIAALVERGIVVVAAVGNNGPNGEPLYPAAYPDVVAITAIDASKRIYRYANRGPHVVFAAPGVNISVARETGGYRELTGTSIAAPHAAAAIARAVASRTGATPSAVVAELKSSAVDLGAKDFDRVFGFGLIAAPETTAATASR